VAPGINVLPGIDFDLSGGAGFAYFFWFKQLIILTEMIFISVFLFFNFSILLFN
jgi:hypothetical protein